MAHSDVGHFYFPKSLVDILRDFHQKLLII